jgi:hypothetical protein
LSSEFKWSFTVAGSKHRTRGATQRDRVTKR